jgi:hypothetical protein
MSNAAQEATTETKQLSITDENISQTDYERLRDGEKVEVEVSAPEVKASSKTADESETLDTEEMEVDADEESSATGDDEALDASKPKKKSGTQRRIEKLVKQRAEVERERDMLREQLLKNQNAKPEGQQPDAKAADPSQKPNSNNYDSYDDYVEALTEWKADQKLKAKDEEVKKETLQNQVKERVKTHNDRVDAYRKDHADFDKHLTSFFEEQGTGFAISGALQELITESDNGPALLHELVKSPEEFVRLNSLSAMSAAREIGRLESKLSSAPEKTENTKTKTITKAPPPARPLNASSANGKKSIYDDDVPFAEYERMRAEQEKRRRGA